MTTKRGKLIVLDGIDGAGKSTQADRLVARLNKTGHPAVRLTFPRYQTFIGATIQRYLRGELGAAEAQSPYLVSLLFATDRQFAKVELAQQLASGTNVVLDRYVSSNQCFQAARLPPRQRPALKAWLTELEYHQLMLPQPDRIIYLAIHPERANQLIDQRGGQREAYEQLTFMRKVATEFRQLAKTDPVAKLIRCESRGQLLTIEQIHERIWKVVESVLNGDIP